MELFLNDNLGKITAEVEEAARPLAILILAHGAGAGMHHPFMHTIAKGLASEGITVLRFNFPYMEQGRKSPGSPKTNIETWKLVVAHTKVLYPGMPVFISGKSYGGRMASHLLAEDNSIEVSGIIYFGFPLHAPGKDSKDRAAHLTSVQTPQLFLQGSNDKLANMELMMEVVKPLKMAEMKIIEAGDHSFSVPKSSGKNKDEVMNFLIQTVADWIKKNIN